VPVADALDTAEKTIYWALPRTRYEQVQRRRQPFAVISSRGGAMAQRRVRQYAYLCASWAQNLTRRTARKIDTPDCSLLCLPAELLSATVVPIIALLAKKSESHCRFIQACCRCAFGTFSRHKH